MGLNEKAPQSACLSLSPSTALLHDSRLKLRFKVKRKEMVAVS